MYQLFLTCKTVKSQVSLKYIYALQINFKLINISNYFIIAYRYIKLFCIFDKNFIIMADIVHNLFCSYIAIYTYFCNDNTKKLSVYTIRC